MDSSSRKIPRGCDLVEGRDIISNLPDELLSQILSRLPTKYAVQTSVLSKFWKDKWMCINNIDINDRELFIRGSREEATFIELVGKMLLLKHILSFHLSCWLAYGLSCMEDWISAALDSNIESFKLFYAQQGISFSFSLFNRILLKNLELKLSCSITMPSKTCFPYLTSLYLDGVGISSENNTTLLTLEFLILKKLKLRTCAWSNVEIVEIHSPALTTFKCETSGEYEPSRCEIKIVGASLGKLVSSGGLGENCVLFESTVTFASLLKYYKLGDERLLQNFGTQVRKLMKGFLSLKHLIISGCLTQVCFYSFL